jgi:glutaredoxin
MTTIAALSRRAAAAWKRLAAPRPARPRRPVRVTLYAWAGAWGPFRVRVPCGECTLSRDILADVLAGELADVDVDLEVRQWLSVWWRPLLRGGWHAPIVMVEGRVVSQGRALNRGLLVEAVIEAAARRTPLTGTRVFAKAGCPHCVRAEVMLAEAGIDFVASDVVAEPRALYEVEARTKPLIGAAVPLTVPQVWLDGTYVGGADGLATALCRRAARLPVRRRLRRAA